MIYIFLFLSLTNKNLLFRFNHDRNLAADGTIDSNPYLEPLRHRYPDVLPYLETQYSTSTQHHFKLIDFVDTPGLVATGRSNDYAYPVDDVRSNRNLL